MGNVFIDNLDEESRKKKREIKFLSNFEYFGVAVKSDIRSIFEDKNGNIGLRGKKEIAKICSFFSWYYPILKGVEVKCPVLEINTNNRRLFPNSNYAFNLKKKLEEFCFISLYDDSYVVSGLIFNPKNIKNKAGFDRKNQNRQKNGFSTMMTYGKSKSYVFNVPAIRILFNIAYEEGIIKDIKCKNKRKSLVDESVLSFDEISEILGTELRSNINLYGVSLKDIVNYYTVKNPQIKNLQKFDCEYNEFLKKNCPNCYDLLNRKSNVSVKVNHGAIRSCAVRTTSKFCNTFTYNNLINKHPEWNEYGQQWKINDYINKNIDEYRDKAIDKVCNELGFNHSTDVYTYDVTSSNSKLLHCKHTGEYEEGDCYEKILKMFDENCEFTKTRRTKIKNFVNRTIFSRENMLFQNLSYSGSLGRLYEKTKKTDIIENVRKLQKCVFDYLGNNNCSNQVFLDESVIMGSMTKILMKNGFFVIQVYDELIVFKKDINAYPELINKQLNDLHKNITLKYYEKYH